MHANSDGTIWTLYDNGGPLVAAAIHDGHEIRRELQPYLVVGDEDRLREEDPYTGSWTEIAGVRLVASRSRFEVDLNRPREKAVYQTPEDAWGLRVWQSELPYPIVRRSLEEYDGFYAAARRLFDKLVAEWGHFVVLDLHSYNHRRDGPSSIPADSKANPEVNIGTKTMDRGYWGTLVDRFILDLGSFDLLGTLLDVRENIKFYGGWFPQFIHENYPRCGCAIAVEFKKIFMDEWTGSLYGEIHAALRKALSCTVDGMLDELKTFVRK